MSPDARLLDSRIPLADASYRDVAGLEIDVPMRYAELVAVLGDGRRVRLRRRSQLLGWFGPDGRRTFYFGCRNGDVICVRTNSARRRVIRDVDVRDDITLCRAPSAADSRIRGLGGNARKFIAVDGSLCFAVRQPWAITQSYTPTLPAALASRDTALATAKPA